MSIQILAELERIGWGFNWADNEHIKCRCPFHDDTNPSCYIELKKQVFKCQAAGCGQAGDIVSFLAGALKTTRVVVMADLETRYKFDNEKTIEPDVIEKYHSQIWEAAPLLEELYARGVTNNDIRKYRLGVHRGRVTIPVQSKSGLYVNIRSYLPGAPGAQKMRNLKGRSLPRLFPIDQLSYDKIVIVGGEVKAIVCAAVLNPKGIGVVCVTAGEGAWSPEFTPLFIGRDTWVIMDIDEGGRKASRAICNQLHRVARSTHDVLLPLDKDKYPKGDPNDFIARERGDLLKVIAEAEPFKPIQKTKLVSTEPEKLDLIQATNAANTAKRLRVTAVVSTLDTAPYIIPKEVRIHCDRSQKCCPLCPVYTEEPEKLYEIACESAAILEMVSQPKSKQLPVIKEELEIPDQCRVCSAEPITYYNIEDSRISPRLEITSRTNDRVMIPALCIGDGLETNETYDMTGRMYPHPLTQQSTLLISHYKASKDALSSYKVKNKEALQLFAPSDHTVDACSDKLSDILNDFESNVTNVYYRRLIHLYVDVTYHSPLLLRFDGKQVKGWVETLIMGDSAQAKSETVMTLMQHYGLGEKIECKNATVPGLLGGVQQLGSRWFITWGVIPTHDKRLVVLEELKGASTEVISKLTDMRSSGVAEIPKIEKRRTHARTRLIALSNPRTDMSISRYNFGIEAIKELVGGLEDIRRFDACLIVSKDEVDAALINEKKNNRPKVEHKYTSALCRELILWAWTRTIDQVIFEPDAERAILDSATSLCADFTDTIPIVDRGSMRYKLARLAAAIAARLYSTDDGEVLIVRKCHVEYVVKMLTHAYSARAFGYKDYTEAQKISGTLIDEDLVRGQINNTPFPADFIKQILYTNKIDLQDLQDWCGFDRMAAQTLLSLLVRKHALMRDGKSYRKTSQFIELLKSITPVERPAHITEEF